MLLQSADWKLSFWHSKANVVRWRSWPMHHIVDALDFTITAVRHKSKGHRTHWKENFNHFLLRLTREWQIDWINVRTRLQICFLCRSSAWLTLMLFWNWCYRLKVLLGYHLNQHKYIFTIKHFITFNISGSGCRAVGVGVVGCTLAAAAGPHNAGSVVARPESSTPRRVSCSGSCYGRVAHKLALERCRLQVSESLLFRQRCDFSADGRVSKMVKPVNGAVKFVGL